MKKIVIFLLFVLSLNASESYYERGKLVNLEEVRMLRDSEGSGIKYFKTKSGQKLGITDDILVKCKGGIDCLDLLNRFSLTDVSKLTDTIFIIKIKDYNTIFSLSRALYESGDVEFAHPNFIKERRKR
ncbi:MAG: hypothetical protein U9P72_10155 [Campylobacterota bacterium]|nr:hypothetical protein [Campylobacterota bacterium]